MNFTARHIAQILDGNIEGNPEAMVNGLSKIDEGLPGTLSFLANPKYTPFIYKTKATVIIVHKNFVAAQPLNSTLIRVEDPYLSFAKLLELYNHMTFSKTGISSNALVSNSAKLGENIFVGDFTCIGDDSVICDNVKIDSQVFIGDHVVIGDNTVIYPGVKIYSGMLIGKNCIFQSGVVIGSDGFGFAPQSDNQYKKVAQIGNVIIEDNVEIGANTTIDRATLGSTIIHSGVKLDNLIQIAHNVEIGENTVIAAQSGISGSTKIGKNCMIGGQVGIIGHLTIGDNVKIAAQSGIGSNIKDGHIVMGSPAFDISKYKKSYVHFRNLDLYIKKLEELENLIKGKDK
ncbi:MAG: UDP-3-O-(3-hydroxymyristoyl)glucosamine N-acyltransferase [Bacteroidetes bacterium]|nr:UDP-3-O-(3-hydroxymyristoyl)glucosamine N-acyltransferase [Bacteroidota bacterium]